MERKIEKIILSLFFFGIWVSGANAAILSVSPNSGSHSVGEVFSVRVLVSSPDAQINAASGALSFPPDKLAITSVSKAGSIINLWAQEPAFDNNAGADNFEGIVLNPGFQGASGQILTVNFRVKSAGIAPIVFNSGSVLANDGLGTNILSGFVNASFNLMPTAQGQEAGQSTTPSTVNPLAPKILSSTNPDPNKWYSNSNPKFSWVIPEGVTAVRLLYDKFPQSVPTVAYEPAVSEKQLENIPDGVWYFHARFRDNNGWGSVAHFRFQIDTTPPEPMDIRFVDTSSTTNPTPTVIFNTTDTGSGIDYYKVKIGDQDFVVVSADTVKSNPYTLPRTKSGKQTLLVQAFDKAGNYETALSDIIISSLPAPIITDYPSIIQPGEIFAVKGNTQSLAEVIIWLEKDGSSKAFTGSSDSKGLFTIAGNGSALDTGGYKLWVEAVDSRGARTSPSEKHDVVVQSPHLIRLGSYAINILTIVVSIVSIVALLILVLWHFWRKVIKSRQNIRKESQEASRTIHKEFVWLKEKLRSHLKSLERAQTKRELTFEERRILSDLKNEVDKVEKTVEKSIDDIKSNLD